MEEPIIEYVHYVRIVEFQSWNNVKGEEQRPFLIEASDPINVEEDGEIVYQFYYKCMYASLGSCGEVKVRVLDEEGNVWRGLEQTIQIAHKKEV